MKLRIRALIDVVPTKDIPRTSVASQLLDKLIIDLVKASVRLKRARRRRKKA